MENTPNCPKCNHEMIELEQDVEQMTDGQQSDYFAGGNRTFSCPNCNHYGLFDIDVNDFDDEDFEEYEIPSEYYANALANKNDLGYLIHDQLKFGEYKDNKLLIKLFYVNLITVLETYLSDAFKYNVLNNDKYLINFIRAYPYFQSKKYFLLNIVNSNGINANLKQFLIKETKQVMNKLIFHKLAIVTKLYKSVFDVEFDESWKILVKRVQIRHHLVHRNGKDEDNKEIEVNLADIEKLEKEVFYIIEDIEQKLKKVLV